MALHPCPSCGCHVRRLDPRCPHCDAPLSVASPRAFTLGATALSAGLSVLACTTDPGPGETGAEGMTTTAGSSSATDTGETSSTTMMGTSDSDESSTTSGDDSMSDTDTDSDSASEPPYGVPDQPCEEFGPAPVVVGANAVEIVAGAGQLPSTCGGSGSASLYAFTAAAEGDYAFTLSDAAFEPVISLFGDSCWEFEASGCAMPPEGITTTVFEGQTVHIAVDSTQPDTGGSATLTITPL